MKLIICLAAPAVMESIATTAPTPKIMPSIVSRLRSLCAMRLESPIKSSLPIPRILSASAPAGGHGGLGSALFALALVGSLFAVRIGQRHRVVGVDAARQHHGRFALP